ncbi:AhpC/TSA family protein [Gammaproteobacteria bacterium]|nr:AhpC/TSA family protein [Gammaproteobacteria bacterium]
MKVLKPREPVPALEVETLSGPWSLAEQNPENFIMVVFYRGLHCPICSKYVHELVKLEGDFSEIGTSVLTLSQDTRERAKQAVADWELGELTVGYGVSDDTIRAWGLHRSAGRGKTSTGIEEPTEFNEPGVFILRTDKSLYWAQVSTMPFARPHFREILGALKFAIEKNYPARGELS